MASVTSRFVIAGATLALIGLAGCGGKSQQQFADERAQIEASMAAAERAEFEHDARVKRDAAAIVAAHNAAERDENAKDQAAAAEQERVQEAAAGK
jgi:hypothetical protein